MNVELAILSANLYYSEFKRDPAERLLSPAQKIITGRRKVLTTIKQ